MKSVIVYVENFVNLRELKCVIDLVILCFIFQIFTLQFESDLFWCKSDVLVDLRNVSVNF